MVVTGIVTKQDVPPDTVLSAALTVHFTVSANAQGNAPAKAQTPEKAGTFHFEVPQSPSAKQFAFFLVDSFGNREIWRAQLEPGSKHDIPLPEQVGSSPKIRIFVDGILMEERALP